MVKNPPANTEDIRRVGSVPGLRRSLGGGHDNLLQYSYLENTMDGGTWQATVHRNAKSWTQLKRLSMHAYQLTSKIPMNLATNYWNYWENTSPQSTRLTNKQKSIVWLYTSSTHLGNEIFKIPFQIVPKIIKYLRISLRKYI